MTSQTFSIIAFSSSAAAATLAAAVMAEIPAIHHTPLVGTKARAEVQAELFSHRDQFSSECALQQNEAQNRNASGYTREPARSL